MKREVSKIIKNGNIVTINEKMEIIENGSIAIDGHYIAGVGKNEEIEEKFDSKKIIDAKGKYILPGFINTHTHIAMSYFKGVADDLKLHDWLENYIWPVESKMLNRKFVYDASLHGISEMVSNGITTFCDMYFYGYFTAEAAKHVGMRAFVGEGVLDHAMDENETVDQMIKYSVEGNNLYKDNDLINFVISPHSIYTCSEENLKKCVKAAKENDVLLHIHVAESEKEFKDSYEKNGLSPFAYLEKIGFLEGKVIAAHGIWLDDKDFEIIKKNNTSISTVLESNLKLVSGIAPLKKYFENGITVSIGTDGSASNNNLSMLNEMDFLSKTHKMNMDDPTFLPAEEIVKMATINGAKTLHMEDKLGSIEVGKYADLIMFDLNRVDAQPMYNIYSHLVYTLSDHHVTDVIINGKEVLKDSKLVTVDEDKIIQKAKEYHTKILDIIKS